LSAVFLESSALVRWLLGHADGSLIGSQIAAATEVAASKLVVLEAQRAIARLEAERTLTPVDAGRARVHLGAAAAHWLLRAIDDEVLGRASAPFPIEPVRSLDAIHLATLATLASALGEAYVVLSTDERIRGNALAMGFSVKP